MTCRMALTSNTDQALIWTQGMCRADIVDEGHRGGLQPANMSMLTKGCAIELHLTSQ